MSNSTSQNHYEALEVNQNASPEVIEKMFRLLAAKYHPDAGGDKDRFKSIVEAFEVLRDQETKDAYDHKLISETQEVSRLLENSKQAGPDAAIRHELLCLFYARRREEGASPALGEMAIQKALDLTAHVVEFHLWYFREKNWVKRFEDGGFAITAEGVDQIDATELKLATAQPRLTLAGDYSGNQGVMVTA